MATAHRNAESLLALLEAEVARYAETYPGQASPIVVFGPGGQMVRLDEVAVTMRALLDALLQIAKVDARIAVREDRYGMPGDDTPRVRVKFTASHDMLTCSAVTPEEIFDMAFDEAMYRFTEYAEAHRAKGGA